MTDDPKATREKCAAEFACAPSLSLDSNQAEENRTSNTHRVSLMQQAPKEQQPFLMRFASPTLRDSGREPPPGTLYTFVERETTDDR